jgi:hypothetical protein
VLGDRTSAFGSDEHVSVWLPVYETLFDLHESSFAELREMRREVAVGQPGDSLKKNEISACARGKRGEDHKPGRLVDEPVQLVDILKTQG